MLPAVDGVAGRVQLELESGQDTSHRWYLITVEKWNGHQFRPNLCPRHSGGVAL